MNFDKFYLKAMLIFYKKFGKYKKDHRLCTIKEIKESPLSFDLGNYSKAPLSLHRSRIKIYMMVKFIDRI